MRKYLGEIPGYNPVKYNHSPETGGEISIDYHLVRPKPDASVQKSVAIAYLGTEGTVWTLYQNLGDIAQAQVNRGRPFDPDELYQFFDDNRGLHHGPYVEAAGSLAELEAADPEQRPWGQFLFAAVRTALVVSHSEPEIMSRHLSSVEREFNEWLETEPT